MAASNKEELLLQTMLNPTAKLDELHKLALEIEAVYSNEVIVTNTQVDDSDTNQPLPTEEGVYMYYELIIHVCQASFVCAYLLVVA